jgi:transposase
MRFVAPKSEEQLDMQTLPRAHDQAVRERTSLMNQLRAVLLERGVVVPQGRARLRVRVTDLLRQGAQALSSRTPLDLAQIAAAQGCLLESAALNQNEILASMDFVHVA